MRKVRFASWIVTFIIGLILTGVGLFFAATSQGLGILKIDAVPGYLGSEAPAVGALFSVGISQFVKVLTDFSHPTSLRFIATYVILALVVIILIIQIICFLRAKRARLLWWCLFTLLVGTVLEWLLGLYIYLMVSTGSNFVGQLKLFVPFLTFKESIWLGILVYVTFLGIFLTVLAGFILLIKTLVYAARFKKYRKAVLDAQQEDTYEPGNNATGGSATNNINTVGNSSPLVVQYINSYGPQGAVQIADKPLTRDDLKEILRELKGEETCCCCGEEPEEVVYKNEEGEELEYLDLDDLKGILRNEVREALDEEFGECECEECAQEEAPVVEAVATEEVKEEKPQVVEEQKAQIATPIVVALPTDIKKEEPAEEVKEENLTEDEVRDLVSEELREALKDLVKPAQTKVVKKVVKQVQAPVKEEKKEEPVKEAKPAPAPVKVQPKPAPRKAEKPVETRGQEKAIEKGETVKLNFLERIAEGDDVLKANYNHIKGLLMSYGLKNRLSNTGDTFRLHKVTYAKLTVIGDSIRVYLALNPKDYESTALPVQDVSNKDAYKEIPLAFKVRSVLSVRRVNELIANCMRQAGFEQDPNFQPADYTKEIVTELDNAKKVEAAISKNKSKKAK
jgi:hypothetical protein